MSIAAHECVSIKPAQSLRMHSQCRLQLNCVDATAVSAVLSPLPRCCHGSAPEKANVAAAIYLRFCFMRGSLRLTHAAASGERCRRSPEWMRLYVANGAHKWCSSPQRRSDVAEAVRWRAIESQSPLGDARRGLLPASIREDDAEWMTRPEHQRTSAW